MRYVVCCAALGLACLGLARVQGADAASDQEFVLKASAGGLAEGNLGAIAVKQASDPAVKKFAQHMVSDHDKANKELIDLSNKKKLRVAPRMDAEHDALSAKLLKLTGADFDREYMAGQVKDHKDTVALFESEAKSGKDEDVKKWAEKTLPIIRDHLKMAQDVQGKLKGTSTKGGKDER